MIGIKTSALGKNCQPADLETEKSKKKRVNQDSEGNKEKTELRFQIGLWRRRIHVLKLR